MQIGTLRNGSLQFTTSRMKVSELVRAEDQRLIRADHEAMLSQFYQTAACNLPAWI